MIRDARAGPCMSSSDLSMAIVRVTRDMSRPAFTRRRPARAARRTRLGGSLQGVLAAAKSVRADLGARCIGATTLKSGWISALSRFGTISMSLNETPAGRHASVPGRPAPQGQPPLLPAGTQAGPAPRARFAPKKPPLGWLRCASPQAGSSAVRFPSRSRDRSGSSPATTKETDHDCDRIRHQERQ
jgi:hypothetical protein